MPAPETMIAAKCRLPPVTERLVERPRLDDLISSLVARYRPVFVYATAGSGKTTAVARALGSVDLPATWLTVDETDAAPGRLIAYLEAALVRAVPAVAGVGTGALRRRIPHREAAGLLAEATAGCDVLLVLDELERLVDAPPALAVLSAFTRYAPASLRMIMISRRELTLELASQAALGGAAAILESDLAFTTSEAEQALATTGSSAIDARSAVEATGGWVAGVLFEAWRSTDHVAGIGGEADPLHGYLASQVLDQLGASEQDFLIATALFTEVTAARAEALGFDEAASVLSSLRARHLPVTWGDGPAMRCHTRFREYLLARLSRRPSTEVAALRRTYGAVLEREGHPEDAVEAYLEAGALGSALHAAEGALDGLVDRLDFAQAERWLQALRPIAPPGDGKLTRAELMLAIARERYAEGAKVVDRLAEVGELDLVVRRSRRAANMMAWCLWHVGRIDEARSIVEVTAGGEETAALEYLLHLVDKRRVSALPEPDLTGGPLDALTMRVRYAHGRLRSVAEPPASPWAAAVSAPWRIGALRALGRLDEAVALYDAGGLSEWAPVWFQAIVAPELMIDLGREQDAREALARGRELFPACGSVVFDMLNRLIEAKLELLVRHDYERADAVLIALAARPEATTYGFIEEQIATWAGMVLLLRGDDANAARRLRRAVRSMQGTDRILELPTAGVLLAEAEWRLGNEEAADSAADAALAAATRQGSNHILLQVLAEFPAVASRRLDADRDADSSWHQLARGLAAVAAPGVAATRARTVLDEFAGPTLLVDGEPVRPRIKKSLELLAYLVEAGRPVSRDELLDGLFQGRSDAPARAYLRQAAHQLREVLPDDVDLRFEGDLLRLAGEGVVQSAHARAEDMLSRAAHLGAGPRLGLLEQALAILGAGPYLGSLSAPWIDARRAQIAARTADIRHEAARAAFSLGRHQEARRLALQVVESDPYREGSWRLLMQIANALGDANGVIDSFRRCDAHLRELGTTPSPTTQTLLSSLRK